VIQAIMQLIQATRSHQDTVLFVPPDSSVLRKINFLLTVLTAGLQILVRLTARDVHLVKIVWTRQVVTTSIALMVPTTTGLTNTVLVPFTTQLVPLSPNLSVLSALQESSVQWPMGVTGL